MSTELIDRARAARDASERSVVDVVGNAHSRAIAIGVPGLVEHAASAETWLTEHHGHIAWAAAHGVEWPLHDRSILDSEVIPTGPGRGAPVTAITSCAPLEWRRSEITRHEQLDPRDSAVEEILQLRHEIDDHATALTLLRGLRPDLDDLTIERTVDELLDLARAVHDAEDGKRSEWYAAVDDYEHALRTFARGGAA